MSNKNADVTEKLYPDGTKEWRRNGKPHREDGPAIIYSDGTKSWYQDGKLHREDGPAVIHYQNGQLHREDGPAVIYSDGTQKWYQNGKPHRENGPAVIHPDGTQRWYRNGKPHRENGPAIIHPDKTQEWYQNGKLHREDGPAIERPDGAKQWYLHGKLQTTGKDLSQDKSKMKTETKELNARLNKLEDTVNTMESNMNYDQIKSDNQNDLEHSMVLDLPPEIAEWAKQANIGVEDMIELSTQLVKIRSEAAQTIAEKEFDHATAVERYYAEVDRTRHESEKVKHNCKLEAMQTSYQTDRDTQISRFRHATMQTACRWASGAAFLSYTAHLISTMM